MPTMGRTADRNKCCSPVHVQKLNRNGGSKEKFKSMSIKDNFILLIIKFNNVTSFLNTCTCYIKFDHTYKLNLCTHKLVRIIKVLLYVVFIFVGSCLATKVFIGNLPAMGRGWIIIKYANDEQRSTTNTIVI